MINKTCLICTKSFEVRIQRKDTAKFCSVDCRVRDMFGKAKRARDRVPFKCPVCSKDFEIIKCRVGKSKNHCCSLKCASRFSAESRSKKLRLKDYPIVFEKPCVQCQGQIVVLNAGFDKPNRKFCSNSCKVIWRNKNVPQTEHQRKMASDRMRVFSKIPHSEERRLKASLARRGEKSRFWQGGLTDENRKARNSIYVRIWREKVFKRDDWTCQTCGARSGKGKAVILNADHIKSWSKYPELRFEVSNGRTLCLDCHKKTDTFGFKATFNTGAYLTALE